MAIHDPSSVWRYPAPSAAEQEKENQGMADGLGRPPPPSPDHHTGGGNYLGRWRSKASNSLPRNGRQLIRNGVSKDENNATNKLLRIDEKR